MITLKVKRVFRALTFLLTGLLTGLLAITAAQAQVFLSNPALRDSPFGSDVTNTRTAGYQVAYVSVDVLNQSGVAVSVTWSVAIDGTTVASATQTVNANSLATFIKAASPAPILTAGSHTITGISGTTTVPRNFTVAPSANGAPTNISLSVSTVAENQPSGTAVGTLSTTDPDAGNTFTYTLVGGTGSTDNGSFTVNGSTLRTAAPFNYEARNSYSVRVRTTDQGGLWHEKAFVISVVDQQEESFRMLGLSGDLTNGFTIGWTCEAGYSYQLKYSETLQAGDWHDLGTSRVWSSGTLTMNHTDTTMVGRDKRNYRIVRTALP